MLEQYYRIHEATGISIHLLPNGEARVHACSVSVKNNQLDIGEKVTDLASLEALTGRLAPKSYLSVNLTGRGILQKQVEKVTEINPQNFTQILPNAQFNDFYIQHFISGGQSFVSVIRKAEADKWIGQLKDRGFLPLMLTLGPFPVEQIMAQLNVYETEVIFNGHAVQRNAQKEWIACQYNEQSFSPFPLKIESELIEERLLLPYAGAFQIVLASGLALIQADVPALAADFENVVRTKKMRVQGLLILSICFGLLLLNFLVFSWLAGSNARLTERVSRTTQSTNDVQQVSDQVKHKEALLKNLGWDDGMNKSSLADQLAGLLPGEVAWKELTFNPVDITASRLQKSPQFLDRRIRIVGTAQQIIPVNEWIARVKTKAWVKNIQLDSYTYNSELNTGQFTVNIDY
jgi:hypothetical protein